MGCTILLRYTEYSHERDLRHGFQRNFLFQRIEMFTKISKNKIWKKNTNFACQFREFERYSVWSQERECNVKKESSERLHNLLVKFLGLINQDFVIGAAY